MDSILLKSNRFCVIDKFILLTAFIEKATAVVLKMFIFFQKISRINTTDHRPPGSRKFFLVKRNKGEERASPMHAHFHR